MKTNKERNANMAVVPALRKPNCLVFFLVILCLLTGCCNPTLRASRTRTFSSFDLLAPGEKVRPAQTIKFEEAALEQVLSFYGKISRRSVIRSGNLPEVKITFSNEKAMSTVEILQALDTVLAGQGIAMVVLGEQYVKAVPAKEAPQEPGPIFERAPAQLPDSSSFVIYIVKLKNVTAAQAQGVLIPFSKLPASIIAVPSGAGNRTAASVNASNVPSVLGVKEPMLILRDYSSNVRQMLQVLEKLEQQ